MESSSFLFSYLKFILNLKSKKKKSHDFWFPSLRITSDDIIYLKSMTIFKCVMKKVIGSL